MYRLAYTTSLTHEQNMVRSVSTKTEIRYNRFEHYCYEESNKAWSI